MDDRKIWLIGGGVLLALLMAFLFWPKGGEDNRRDNLLSLATRYYEDQEYQRALDRIDELLIMDPNDEEANTLRRKVVEEKRIFEEEQRQQELEALRTGQEGLEGTLSQLQQSLRDRPSLENSAQDREQEAAMQRQRQLEEERRRLEEQERQMAQMNEEERRRQQKLNDGVQAMYREDFSTAKSIFNELIDEADMAIAYARLGEAYFLERKDSPDNRRIAVENLSRAIEKDSSSYWPHLILGDIYQETENFATAVQEYEKADRLNPRNGRILYELAKMYFRTRRFQASADTFRQVTELEPDHSAAFYNMGGALLAVNKETDAIRAFQSAIRIRPDYGVAHNTLGQLYVKQGKLDLARGPLEKAAQLEPDRVNFRLALGNLYFRTANYQGAEREFLAALAQAPNRADINNNLATTLLAIDQNTRALDYAMKATEQDNSNTLYFYTLGLATEAVGDRNLAKAAYERALSLSSSNVAALINLAAILEEVDKDLDGALKLLRQAYDLEPQNMKVNNNLGQIYLKKELYDQSIEYFTRALELNKDDHLIRYNLALAFIETNQGDLAQTVLEQVIKLKPDFWDAYYRLGIVLINKGETEKGEENLQKVLSGSPNHWAAEEIRRILN